MATNNDLGVQPHHLPASLALASGDPSAHVVTTPPINLRVRRQPEGVYRRRRLGAAAVVLGLALSVVGMGQAQAERSPADIEMSSVGASISMVVQPGDTLWDLAAELAPGDDTRAVVARLVDHLGGPGLQVGERIEIPADLVG